MGTLKCSVCGRRYRYSSKKYVDDQPNRLIATRRHYSKYHPTLIRRWHKGIKHPHKRKKT